MNRPLRIGNFSGFYGDRADALAELAGADIDVLTGDYLAEVTMLVLAKLRAKDRRGGYAASFPRQLEPALALIAERRLKVVVNAGGLNPAGLGEVVTELVAAAGVELSVAVVDGDDLLPELATAEITNLHDGTPLGAWEHQPLTANAYLGGWGIAAALGAGADLVVTGRVADASLVVGPAAWWHGWRRDEFDALAGAVAAGHVIECSTQVTGGNYSGFTSLEALGRPGLPIATIDADGSAEISKAGDGGAVTVGTVTAQLLYEIGAPEYFNADVTTHFDTVQLAQTGPDRVTISGTRGSAPPSTTKVAVTALGGYRNSFTTVVTGLEVDAKIAWFESAVAASLSSVEGIESLEFERIGTVAAEPADQGEASLLVRTTATGTEHGTGRAFGAAVIELALANFPGFYGLSLPGPATAFGTYWPGLIAQDAVTHRVTLADGTIEEIVPTVPTSAGTAPSPSNPPASGVAADTDAAADPHGAGPSRPLGEFADARSGDKGGDANVGIWVRQHGDWPWLQRNLTTDWIRQALPAAAELAIDRHEFDNLGAVNFVVHGLLGDGATANTRVDSQAKALGEYLRARPIVAPRRPGD